VIVTEGLTKRFGSATVVNRVDLDVRDGDIYGFLGANGSGKTTTVRMLLGLVLPTQGRIELLGQPMPKAATRILPQIGALIEGPAAYGHLSARANLTVLDASGPGTSRRTRATRVVDVLDQVGLGDVGGRPVRKFSLGMRQRLGLAAALLRKPRLLILDEPTNGLDPQGIREIRTLLLALAADGTTIFLSSHLLAEVEQLCTRIGVLDRGRLLIQEQLDVLQAPTGNVVIRATNADLAGAVLGDRVISRDRDRMTVRAHDAARLNAELVDAGVAISELGPEQPRLEDIVLAKIDEGGEQ
jgi:ABC-type multidrug transport system ATPase subunit